MACGDLRRYGIAGMIAAVSAEEFVVRPSYMGCRNCDYGDLCEMSGRGE